MSSKQKAIRDALAAMLTPLVPAGNFFRAVRRDLGPGELPALTLWSREDRPVSDEDDHQAPHQRTYTLRVEIRVAALTEDDSTDALACAVRSAVLADDRLGGLVYRTTWSSQAWDGDEGDPPIAGTALDFSVYYLWEPEA